MKKFILELFDLLALIGIIALVVSVVLSLFNMMSTSSPCRTNGYYLPITFVMCNVNEARP